MARKHSQTKERLMEAALELFTEKGFAGASTREIVAKSGVTKPTLYYHFGSKEKLYSFLIEEWFERFHRMIAQIAAADFPPVKKLAGVVNCYLDYCRDFPGPVKLTLMSMYRSDHFAPEVDIEHYVRPTLQVIAGIIQEGMAEKQFKKDDPLKLCLQLVGMIHTQVLVMLKGKGKIPLSRAEEIVNTFVKGIGKP